MKILMCSNMYPPNFVGGAELIMHCHAKTLKRLGHDVFVFAGDPYIEGERHSVRRDEFEGIEVHRVRLTHEDYSPDFVNFSHRQVEGHFDALLRNLRPDVVHFHNIIGLSVGLIGIARSRGIRTALTVHDHWGFCFKNTAVRNNGAFCRDYAACRECMPFISDGGGRGIPIRMRNDFVAMQLQKADVLISPSRYLAEAYIQAGIPRDKMRVIPNGIDVKRFSDIRKRPSDGKVRFSYIGHLGPHKGIHVLLEAVRLVGCEKPILVNLVGGGEIESSLRQEVQAAGLSRCVRFIGKISNDLIETVYRETDVLVLPSIWPENQPVTITEAMASGMPVIASRAGGIPELVDDGKTGFLFDIGNARALARLMLEFLSSRDKMRFLGENARDKIAGNTIENQVNKILALYEGKASSRRPPVQAGHLVACAGFRVTPQCSQAIDDFLAGQGQDALCFVMSSWLDEGQFRKSKIFWVVDSSAGSEEAAKGMRNGIPLLAPEENVGLKNICSTANCGLYYRNSLEAKVCLEYLINNEAVARRIGENGREAFFSNKIQLAAQPPAKEQWR